LLDWLTLPDTVTYTPPLGGDTNEIPHTGDPAVGVDDVIDEIVVASFTPACPAFSTSNDPVRRHAPPV
jgi:hypothetical protein